MLVPDQAHKGEGKLKRWWKNYFNIGMVYTWQFAPGSFLNMAWKNATYHNSDLIDTHYFQNLNNTLQADQNNTLSLKVMYFLDYLRVKSWVQGGREG